MLARIKTIWAACETKLQSLGEVAQSGKGLSHKPKVLPEHSCQMPGPVVQVCNPSAGEAEKRDSLALLASQSRQDDEL